MIHRKFIALIAATSIAITGFTSAPAYAKDDTAKIIVGAAALALIGVAIAQSNKDKRRNRTSRGQIYDNGGYYGDNSGYRNDDYYDNDNRYNNGYRRGHDNYNRPLPRRAQRKVLPRSCKVEARTRNGRIPAYGARCLSNNFRYANALPYECAFNARTRRHGQRHTVYARDCLARYGYRPGNY
jgi:Ni/Co efflux regulator RcnB